MANRMPYDMRLKGRYIIMIKLRAFAAVAAAVLLCGCSVSPVEWEDSESDKGHESSYVASSESSAEAKATNTEITASGESNKSSDSSVGYFYSDIKAVWVSYLELEPILKEKTEAQFKKSFAAIIKNAADLGLNTVIVQVRPFADALYYSEIFPPSGIWTQDMKTTEFDPLEIMLKAAHESKMSFHAWVNPLRGATESQLKLIDDKYTAKKLYSSKNKAKKVKDRYYFNPAYSSVKKLIADGVKELVTNYNVDAVHIDDYFYPTTAKSFDSKAYKKYANNRTLSQFRLDNCSDMVKRMYSAAHSRENVKFGISPQGNIQNDYSTQYADVKTWCSQSGYTDYIMPQIYYGFQNSSSPFRKVCRDWAKYVTNKDIILAAGLACHKINMAIDAYAGSGKNEWAKSSDVISRQIGYLTGNKNYSGFSLYSYKSIFENDEAKTELENIKKLLASDG